MSLDLPTVASLMSHIHDIETRIQVAFAALIAEITGSKQHTSDPAAHEAIQASVDAIHAATPALVSAVLTPPSATAAPTV